MSMKTALKMKTTPKMDRPQKKIPKNVEDLSEVKRTSKSRHILHLHYDQWCTSSKMSEFSHLGEIKNKISNSKVESVLGHTFEVTNC